ncbi:hypothetical protein [Flavobacterium sp.]|jgi:hypothetical protein|uniref:hypothetical protein n=1 Tax=Flavobacterium sp. TaxID=239 RepID=UPI0037C12989
MICNILLLVILFYFIFDIQNRNELYSQPIQIGRYNELGNGKILDTKTGEVKYENGSQIEF